MFRVWGLYGTKPQGINCSALLLWGTPKPPIWEGGLSRTRDDWDYIRAFSDSFSLRIRANVFVKPYTTTQEAARNGGGLYKR